VVMVGDDGSRAFWPLDPRARRLDHAHITIQLGERVTHSHICEDCGIEYAHRHRIKTLAESTPYGQSCWDCTKRKCASLLVAVAIAKVEAGTG